MADHVRAKRKAGTAEFYRDILDRIVKAALGTTKADKLTRLQVSRMHSSLAGTPFQANRVLAVVGSMYAFAGRAGIVPEGTNPARGIVKFQESHRERFLTGMELERLGSAIREAETTGIPWSVDETKPTAKVGCWDMLRQQPPHATLILITTHCGAPRKPSPGEFPQR